MTIRRFSFSLAVMNRHVNVYINVDIETIENLHRNQSDSSDSGFYTRGISTEAAVPPLNTGGQNLYNVGKFGRESKKSFAQNLVELGVKRDTSEHKTKLQ